jgi:hypothetical protein
MALARGNTHIVSIDYSPARGDKSISYHRLSLLDGPDADTTMAIGLVAQIINNVKTQQSGDNPGKVLVHKKIQTSIRGRASIETVALHHNS